MCPDHSKQHIKNFIEGTAVVDVSEVRVNKSSSKMEK
jgi:hypothetical protein